MFYMIVYKGSPLLEYSHEKEAPEQYSDPQ